MPIDQEQVFALEVGQEVGCYHCMQGSGLDLYGGVDGYRRGEAVLAGPGHTPYDANANYICLAHLDRNATIVDPTNGFQPVSVADYAKLGRPEVVGEMYLKGVKET